MLRALSVVASVVMSAETVIMIAVLPLAGAMAADEFGAGLAAYNAADYGTAVDHWRPLADENDPKAQTALAFLYLRGLGVRQDDVRAADWYRRAAELGRPEAQLFLGSLYYQGRGVPQSFTLAHVWCEIALARGMAPGLACRDAAAERLSTAERREAYRLAAAWLYRHTEK